ncbi:MAG TPA: C40 family peptidase, partial [Gaiellaceae bacterium]|nr:C40 family peptidase [Gaiellaceae bacterium]
LQREIAAREAADQQAAVSPAPQPGLVSSPAAVANTGGGHAEAAQIALRYLGIPYVWGGASTSGFDCSGLVMYVYAQLGISLPHYTVSQWDATIPVAYSDMQPGDLVFFDGLGHVGIYIGNGQFVDAPHTGSVVRIDSLGSFGGFDGARRVP